MIPRVSSIETLIVAGEFKMPSFKEQLLLESRICTQPASEMTVLFK
jgi:hypothetical protein